MKTSRLVVVAAGLALLLAPAAASAQDGRPLPLGVRAGITSWDGYDQFHVGAHTDLGEIAPNVALLPSVEFGFGDDLTVVAANGDLVYRFTELVTSPWGLYGGGCLSFLLTDVSGGETDSDLGLGAVAGMTYLAANGHTSMLEFRFGLMDSPDLKVTFGYTLF